MTSLPTSESLLTLARSALTACGAHVLLTSGVHPVRSPINGLQFGAVAGLNSAAGNELTVDIAVERATAAFATWRTTPAPRRAEVVRHLAALLREHIGDLATIVSIEAGKIRSEALGEVQEMIDICDYAVGLSRTMGLSRGRTTDEPSRSPLRPRLPHSPWVELGKRSGCKGAGAATAS